MLRAALALVLLFALYAVDANTNAIDASATSGCYWLPSSYGDCDVTCGTGMQTRDLSCYCGSSLSEATSCADLAAPSVSKSCELPCLTYEWVTGSWSGCDDLECGSAYSTRTVQCQTSAGEPIESSYCSGEAPCENVLCEAGVSCDGVKNTTWNWGEWTTCSSSCGAGHETRDRWCISSDGVVDDTKCDCDGMPTYRDCNLGTCETFSWNITDYSSCSVSCGSGYRERTVTCISSSRGIVPNAECEAALPYEKPSEVVMCTAETAVCPWYEWRGEGFGNCSVSCGAGQAVQTVNCYNALTNEVAESSLCDGSYPATIEDCNERECVTCDWVVEGTYSDCSASCGLGEMTREVSCSCSDGTVDTTYTLCAGTMPESTEDCYLIPCTTCIYLPADNFGECSATCGTDGTATRSVECVCDDGSVSESACAGMENTYSTQESCNVVTCPTYSWVVGNWSDCSVSCSSGGEFRTVECVADLTGDIMEYTYCDGSAPAWYQSCTASIECEGPHPQPDDTWTECSASCGNGITTSSWICVQYGETVDSSLCSDLPETTKDCNEGTCETYDWLAGNWSDCSVSCGVGASFRTVTCESNLRGTVEDFHCDSDTRPDRYLLCTADIAVCPAYSWNATWSECSASCDAGTKTMTYWCQETHTLEVVDSSYCNVSLLPSTTVKVCLESVCEVYDWVIQTNWTDCSASCGGGVSTRTVECVGSYGTIDYTNSLCSSITRPDTQADCGKTACYTYRWVYGESSDCSTTCGEGERTRTVQCIRSPDEVVVDDSFCDSTTQPESSIDCTYGTCPVIEVYWTVSSYSDCDVRCGSSVQTRSISCTMNITTDGTTVTTSVEATYCAALETPATQQTCDTGIKCTDPQCLPATWSDCSASCGDGQASRECVCMNQFDEVVDVSECTGEFVTSLDCNYGPCETFEWTVGSYSGNCSVSCGTGVEERDVYCYSNLRGYVAWTYCAGSPPSALRECVRDDCVTCELVPSSTTSWSDCSATCGLGEQTRSLVCECTDGTTSETACASMTSGYSTARSCSTGVECQELYKWVNGTFVCGVTCGTGIETRTVQCVGVETGTVDVTGQQCYGQEQPASAQTCEETLPECEVYCWVYDSSWSECSATCDFGTQTRSKACVGSFGTTDTTGVACLECDEDVATVRDCFPKTCEVCTWQVGSFSECGVTCGDSTQSREVACVGNRGTVCESTACAAYTKPNATQECAMHCCTEYSWYVGAYGSCSVTCGTGTKSRDVYCHDKEGVVMDASYCDGSHPGYDSSCETGVECEAAAWTNGEWSDCSASCGAGSRERSVTCVSAAGELLDDSACASASAPASSSDCNLCACESTSWEIGSWSDCSVSCGTGFEQRSVECLSTLRGYVPSDECSGSKAVDHQPCTTVCYSWQAGAWGDCVDGTYTRNVYCVGTDGSIDSTGALCTGSQLVDTDVCA